jgi:signal transduction histidine kinase
MLKAFIREHHEELSARARARVSLRKVPLAMQAEQDRVVPDLLTQLAALLSGPLTHGADDAAQNLTAANAVARERYLSAEGLTIAQVVHDYSDVGEVVTELAVERLEPIPNDDLLTFHRCLADAIAGAVTAYAQIRESAFLHEGAARSGVLAHELRNVLSTAMLSFDSIRRGAVGTGGSSSALHARSLERLRDLVDRSLTDVRLNAQIVVLERVVVADFLEEAGVDARTQAQARDLELSVSPVDPNLIVEVDRHLLASAITNLLQNAFKFTRPHSLVSLMTHSTGTRVCINVEDQCGGLRGNAEDLFHAFAQHNADRTGVGLGLLIARRAVEANHGQLRVLDLPRRGCRFTVDLPRSLPPTTSVAH